VASNEGDGKKACGDGSGGVKARRTSLQSRKKITPEGKLKEKVEVKQATKAH